MVWAIIAVELLHPVPCPSSTASLQQALKMLRRWNLPPTSSQTGGFRGTHDSASWCFGHASSYLAYTNAGGSTSQESAALKTTGHRSRTTDSDPELVTLASGPHKTTWYGPKRNVLELEPRGSKYPIFEVSGSKNHTLNGIWDQRP